ncbi:MAG TPA: hypothetical protein VLE54_00505, partial [Thermoanaerobaculia bacterium]|nr:hypothetical protein [Thermoanaerobaculia bacterium]
MRTPSRVARALAVLALLFATDCASRKLPLPTLEDYSDRVSIFAERFREDWASGADDPDLYAPDFAWTGPLPGDALSEVPARPPLSIRMYRAKSATPLRPFPRAGERSGPDLRQRLREIRSRFA